MCLQGKCTHFYSLWSCYLCLVCLSICFCYIYEDLSTERRLFPWSCETGSLIIWFSSVHTLWKPKTGIHRSLISKTHEQLETVFWTLYLIQNLKNLKGFSIWLYPVRVYVQGWLMARQTGRTRTQHITNL